MRTPRSEVYLIRFELFDHHKQFLYEDDTEEFEIVYLPRPTCDRPARNREVAGPKPTFLSQSQPPRGTNGAQDLNPVSYPAPLHLQIVFCALQGLLIGETGFEPAAARPPAGAIRFCGAPFGVVEPRWCR